MKKLISIILISAMTFLLPVTASAAGLRTPTSVSGRFDHDASVYYDDYYYDDWLNEVYWALEEKMSKEYKGKLDLPFWCWYDINRDGINELIVDNNEGKKGVETVSCKMLKGMGSKDIITKGDFSVYYWDFKTEKAASLKVNSGDMFLSVTPSGWLVASSVKGSTETYTVYGFYDYSYKLQAKTYTLTYSGNNFKSITIKNPNGKYEPIDDDWFACIELFGILNSATPLVFYQTS